MKRILSVAIALVLLLSACTRKEDPQPDGAKKPEGAYVYYNIAQMRGMGMYYGGGGGYGLVRADGEVLLPREYDAILLLTTYGDYTSPSADIPADERYFVAYDYPDAMWDEGGINDNPVTDGMGEEPYDQEEPTYDDGPMEYEEPDYFAMQPMMALISPQGKLVTGFDYYNIYRIGEDLMVAQLVSDPKSFVKLGKDGAESPLDDEALGNQLTKDHSWMWNDYQANTARSGPDVPAEGFEQVLELPNGSYWGGLTYTLEEPSGNPGDEFYGKGDYRSEFRLYSEAGVLLKDTAYSYVERVRDGVYYAGRTLYNAQGEYGGEEYYLLDAEGNEIKGPFVEMNPWGVNPYLVAGREHEYVVVNTQTMEEEYSFERVSEDLYYNIFRAGEHICAVVSSSSATPKLYVLDTGEEIIFNEPGGSIDSCNSDLTRFILSRSMGGKGDINTKLVDREGNTVSETYSSLYEQYGALLGYRYDMNSGMSKQYLLDWEGNVLLGAEYSEIEIVPGNAALAVRGDVVGLVDFSGNWIYSESIFQSLEA